MMEIWKDIEQYKGLYQISNLGRIKALSKHVAYSNGCVHYYPEKILKEFPHVEGYALINLTDAHKKQTSFRVHRLVADAFIPNTCNKPSINHINSIRNDNSVENIEWCTPKENTEHRMIFGNKYSGLDHKSSKRVSQYSLDGTYIQDFENIDTATKQTGIFNISACCRSIRSVAGGFKWRYAS